MIRQLDNHRSRSPRRRAGGTHGPRRRGTVLVFVLALLGILFVMGVAFVALTQFESKTIRSERERALGRRSADALFQEIGRGLQEGLGGSLSFGGPGDLRAEYAELPLVHNTFSPVEPYVASNGALSFQWLTDLEPSDPTLPPGLRLRRRFPSGLPALGAQNASPEYLLTTQERVLPADADGDGVVDSLAVDVRTLGLFSDSQMALIAPALNAESNPNGSVHLATRILPHGGLVDLNQAHPTMIQTALNLDSLFGVDPVDPPGTIYHRPTMDHVGYAPSLEEVAIRRRNSLPARSLSPSALTGNAFLDRDQFDYGNAEMFTILFNPRSASEGLGYETVFEDDHRYWPMDPGELFPSNNPDPPPTWAVRMEPDISFAEVGDFEEYDQRHLTTVTNHDDNVARATDVVLVDETNLQSGPRVVRRDLMDMMVSDNLVLWGGPGNDECRYGENSVPPPPGQLSDYTGSAWFELPDYPHTVPNGYDDNGNPLSWCMCADESTDCRPNARKGRLRLSLPWLDEALDANKNGVFRGPDGLERAHRLVQEVFTAMLLNARSPTVSGQPDIWGHERDLTPQDPNDDAFVWEPNFDAISYTAASLTANLFDYMDLDVDHRPTRVLMRSSDFQPSPCGPGNACDPITEGACLADGFCERAPQANGPLLDQAGRPHYVYGIEAQPYITEIATVTAGDEHPEYEPGQLAGFAVELLNPYPDTFLMDAYSIVSIDPMQQTIDGVWGDSNHHVRLTGNAASNDYTVYRAGTSDVLPPSGGRVFDLERNNPSVPPTFITTGHQVYLVREVNYGDPAGPARIVVDEFTIDGSEVGVFPRTPQSGVDELWSIERANVAKVEAVAGQQLVGPWFAPVPALPAVLQPNVLGGSLNGDNVTLDPNVAMVEAVVANIDSFARAFPTTGSMLMLMRNANRATWEFNYDASQTLDPLTPLAFTARLDDEAQVLTYDDFCRDTGSAPRFMRQQLDNGRMPIFDEGGLHRRSPCEAPVDTPGDLTALPWGQLVFDYFTALPLRSNGPYEFSGDTGPGACCDGQTCFEAQNEQQCLDAQGGGIFAGPGTICDDVECGTLRDLPKVDMDGLRVHGRLNINAAPWKVLAGLPMMRALAFDHLPPTTQAKVVNLGGMTPVLGPVATPIGEEAAKAIVAYREMRPLGYVDGSAGTGNYGDTRRWNPPDVSEPNPTGLSRRRGSGFMSVGELANVDHDSASPGFGFSIFPAGLNPQRRSKDFVSAASRLMAMGDWMTVRSHVFTVYGLLLGDEDLTIEVENETEQQTLRTQDVLSRAIRFQETLDRLPTYLGEPLPHRIGERVLGGYTDAQSD